MKNLKKVLALVLAFACAFTMFAGALTFSDVKPGDDYSAAITMLSDLEVISGDGKGNYNPTGTITRAEACVLIANIMNGGKADTARFAGGSNFSDVAKTFWGESAIAYCVQNGVTAGVGGGKFAPSRAITDAEFVAMVTRAMGYDTPANPLSFPYGNYTAAVNNGLVDNVPYVEGSPCTKGEAAQILYDALFADYARYTANQNVIHNADDDASNKLIKVVFGLDRAAEDEESKCKQHYWVILGADSTKADTIIAAEVADKDQAIGDVKEFEFTGDVSDLIGYKVVLWGKNTHSNSDKTWEVDTVKAIETVDGQVVYGNDVDEDEIDITKVAYGKVNYVAKFDVDDLHTAHMQADTKNNDVDQYVVVEGQNAEKWLDKNNSATFKFIDWDNDEVVDFVAWDVKAYAQVEFIDKDEIDLVSATGVKTTLGRDEDDYVVVADGVEEDDIVEITVTRAYDKGEKGEVLTITLEAIEPETADYTKRVSNKTFYFDGEEVSFADEEQWVAVGGNIVKGEAANDEAYKLYKDVNGNIVFMEKVEGETDGFFMVLDTEDGTPKRTTNAQSRKVPATIDVMLTDGTIESYDVAYDLDVLDQNGNAVNFVYDEDDYSWTEVNIVGYVFEYTLEDDVVTELKYAIDAKTTYEYDATGKNERIDLNGTANTLKGDDFLFVVTPAYVIGDDNANKGIKVDTDEVMAITDLDQLPDEIDNGADTKPATVLRWRDNQNNDYSALVAGDFALAASHTSKRVVNGAILAVDDLAFLRNNVKVGLVTLASEYKKNGDLVYDVKVAMDGKYDEYTTVAVDDYDDLFVDAGDGAAFNAIVAADNTKLEDDSIGLYCELYFNEDGEITRIDPMEKGVHIYEGKIYMVDRLVVDTYNADKGYMTFLPATVAEENDKNEIVKVSPVFDADDYAGNIDVAEDVSFFTIDQKIKSAGVGTFSDTINGFFKNLYKKISVADDQKVSNIRNQDQKDRLYLADVVFKGDRDEVVATYTFKDYVKELEPHDYGTLTYEVNGYAKTPDADGVIMLNALTYGDANTYNIVVKDDGTPIATGELKILATTDAGTYTKVVDFEQECAEGDAVKAGSVTVKVVVNPQTLNLAGALEAGTWTSLNTIQLNGDASKIVGTYDVAGVSSVNGKANVPALTSIVEVSTGVYGVNVKVPAGSNFVAATGETLTYTWTAGNYAVTLVLTAQ